LVDSSCGCRCFFFSEEEGSGKECCDWTTCLESDRVRSKEMLESQVLEKMVDILMLTISAMKLEMRVVLHVESICEEKVEEVEKVQKLLVILQVMFPCYLLGTQC